MKAKLIKILSFFTSVAMIFSVVAITPVSAATESQIRSEIKRLQEKQSEQQQKINALKKDASKQYPVSPSATNQCVVSAIRA